MADRRSYGIIGTDEAAIKFMVANSNHRYYIRVNNDGSRMLVQGKRTDDHFKNGSVEFSFNADGELFSIVGKNDEIPEPGFWGRLRFLLNWRVGVPVPTRENLR